MPNISFSQDGMKLSYAADSSSNSRYTPINHGTTSGTPTSREQLIAGLKRKAQLASNMNKIQGNLITSMKADIDKLGGSTTPAPTPSAPKPRYEPIRHDDDESTSRYEPIEDSSNSFSTSGDNSPITNIIINLQRIAEEKKKSGYKPI